MQVTLTVPDDLAPALFLPDVEPGRSALLAVALDAFRERRITAYQLRNLLGIGSRFELHGLLKQHQIEIYTAEDFEQDLASLDPPRNQSLHPTA